MNARSAAALAWQQPTQPWLDETQLLEAIARVREPLRLVRRATDGTIAIAPQGLPLDDDSLVGILPPLYPEWLGDRGFTETHGCRFPYVVGEMARGIATAEMVIAATRAGLMGFFGSAGLPLGQIEAALHQIQGALRPEATAWGANLIHSPQEPAMEDRVVDLFLECGVRRVSASAFMALSPAIVRYVAKGLEAASDGSIRRSNFVFAKVSRPEVAARFMAPPPDKLLRELTAAGRLTPLEAELASRVPVAEDFTVESDSGGHTDNRPLAALFPTILQLRDELSRLHGYDRPIRIGAAGSIGTPSAVAAAFGLGASYVLTGSINQCAVESGLSEDGRLMLANAGIADIAMAPAADMFELGVKVQVLKRGAMFSTRGHRLYELYRRCDGLDDIPPDERAKLEQEIFREPLSEIAARTLAYFRERDPAQVERAEREPKHLMALVFRWYLFMGAQWAREGVTDRRIDYQIWCGPAMGAFNSWVKGSFLEPPANRTVAQIARNLMEGAAVITRAQQLRSYGVAVPEAAFAFRARPLA
jgi:trans-AT polyketide synthase/acyltransferase/oxidoreductase domain-containing protein